MKRYLKAVFLAVAGLSLLAGCGNKGQSASSGSTKILITTTLKGDAFRESLISALESACQKQGASYDTVYADESAEAQVEQV